MTPKFKYFGHDTLQLGTAEKDHMAFATSRRLQDVTAVSAARTGSNLQSSLVGGNTSQRHSTSAGSILT